MLGLMQEWPLLCHRIIDHAATCHPKREVVTRSVEGPIHRTNYAEIRTRALKVSQRLKRARVQYGDRIGTLAWNTWRHLEVWYGIMGIGAVCHTINPRLFPEQIAWIIDHAQDRMILTDVTFVPLLEAIASRIPSIEQFVILTDRAHMPETSLKNAMAYEDWIADVDGDFHWDTFDENTAAGLCYTSGTTGHPKGVVYSHRSNILHALTCSSGDMFGNRSSDAILPVVPLFHANGWGLPFFAPMIGSKLVFPGAKMDGASIYELVESEDVTDAAGVPTIWLMLLQHIEANKLRPTSLKTVLIGGSAVPRSMIKAFDELGVDVRQGWGMTETSPLGAVSSLKAEFRHLRGEEKYDVVGSQGHAPFMIEMKLDDDVGRLVPRDGKTWGNLKVRGPAVARAYYKLDKPVLDDEGFFDTGDIATIDSHAYMRITDRSKDVIKSGGEWISSIALENIAAGHPKVAEAAVIGLHHPKWDERPLLIIRLKPGESATAQELLSFMQDRVIKWWMPDDVVFVDVIPHTATGKIKKTELREQFKRHRLPTA